LCWKEQGDFDLALADYNAVLQLDPSAVAYDNRGNVWQAMGQFDKAIADYTKAIHLNPKYVLSYVGRGLAWQSKNEDEKAIEDYNHALRLNPRYARAYKDRGLIWQIRKDFDRAMSDYKQAIEIDPNYANAYREMAWVWATCADSHWRDGKQAVEYATKACELSGWTNPGYFDVLACAYAEEHDFNSAVKYERQAINLNSDDAEFVAAAKKRLDLFEQNKPYRE
jgi:tetratricopeptide (TPR) repeat protein